MLVYQRVHHSSGWGFGDLSGLIFGKYEGQLHDGLWLWDTLGPEGQGIEPEPRDLDVRVPDKMSSSLLTQPGQIAYQYSIQL